MSVSKHNCRNQRGFTLLEMLIALGLMAMLVVGMMRLMAQGTAVWSNSDRDIRAVENDKIAIDFIRKMLHKAKPMNWGGGLNSDYLLFNPIEGTNEKIFVGKADALYFAAPLPASDAEHLGIYLFKIAAQQTDEYANKALVVSYWLLGEESLDKTLEGKKKSEVIMTDVDSVSFRYFGNKDSAGGLGDQEWQSDWEEMSHFPLAVEMSLKRSKFDPENPESVERVAWQGLVFSVLQRSLR